MIIRAGYRVRYFLGTDRIASIPPSIEKRLVVRYQISIPKGQWCSLVFCSEHTVIFPSLTRPKATPHKHYTNVYSMHLHVTDSILKDCLCDINMSIYYKQHKTANDIYSWGDWTDFLLC